MTKFSEWIVQEAPREAHFYKDDVEDMLWKLAKDTRNPSDVDIKKFIFEFEHTRDAEKIMPGIYGNGR